MQRLIQLVERLNHAVVQVLQLAHGLVRHIAAEPAYMQGVALGIAQIVRQPIELL